MQAGMKKKHVTKGFSFAQFTPLQFRPSSSSLWIIYVFVFIQEVPCGKQKLQFLLLIPGRFADLSLPPPFLFTAIGISTWSRFSWCHRKIKYSRKHVSSTGKDRWRSLRSWTVHFLTLSAGPTACHFVFPLQPFIHWVKADILHFYHLDISSSVKKLSSIKKVSELETIYMRDTGNLNLVSHYFFIREGRRAVVYSMKWETSLQGWKAFSVLYEAKATWFV